MDRDRATSFVTKLTGACVVGVENEAVAVNALFIFNRYNLQPFDSKIVASALHTSCSTLYSEDMQHGLIIEKRLTIINPFI